MLWGDTISLSWAPAEAAGDASANADKAIRAEANLEARSDVSNCRIFMCVSDT
jgi:hypothetical protein